MLILAAALNGVPEAWAAYDLAITAFRADPANGNTATKFTYFATVKNLGSVPAEMKELMFQRNGVVLGSAAFAPWGSQHKILNPGQTYDCTITGYGTSSGYGLLPFGRNIVNVTINGLELGLDLNPANNIMFVQVEVLGPNGEAPGWPDLQIKNLSARTSEGKDGVGLLTDLTAGNSVKIWAPLFNMGTQPAPIPFGMVLVEAVEQGQTTPLGSAVNQISGNVIKSNESSYTEFEIPAEKLMRVGRHTITITADPKNIVREGNENNSMGYSIDVKGCDLAVTKVIAAPQSPATNQPFTLEVTIKNMSSGKALYLPQGPVLANYRNPARTTTVPAPANFRLAAQQEYKFTVTMAPFTNKAETYNIFITVDPTNDPNQANNTFTLPLTLKNASPGALGSSPAGIAPAQQQTLPKYPIAPPPVK
jgi:hypothetical protein